ncbi:DNA mismatch repair protein MSH6 [Populus alba]|uniref:DNA mismatch repair protein n=1 Tax=Populus alba x Populus x berolinensis TaxID=444605 RepID=A0AAD6PZ22_9ROSI|nr:DNA mismatch repair protein MSH6 [Populus alba]KAJ6972861.1 DNA mismatch repair protein MSH6 [Populus alba x Populus x berolinensis]
MAPSRKQSNGRSPIVNPQRQITAFFSKTTTTPSPTLSKKQIPKSHTKPNPNPSSRTQSPSSSPTTPSPVQSKPKKPLLVIGQTPSPSPSTVGVYGKEAVERRVRVYWPLDKSWYEGLVKSYDDESKKHLIQYDDREEELLDLSNEKIEWVEPCVKKFKRLRRGSLGFRKIVLEDDEMENVQGDNGGADCGSGGDDSSDEDWGKNAEKDVSEEEDVDLMDEEEADDGKKGKRGGKDSRKRKASGEGGKLDSGKKGKSGEDASTRGVKVSVVEPVKNKENGVFSGVDNALMTDASERFSTREAEKFPFLGRERRDAKRRRPGDVDYDPRTLYLPAEFAKSLTGGQRQWWEFKSKHMDKVLFFKMGKFYELFEMDAHVGAKELDLQYMKGEQPHCGFPEKNFSLNVEKLARKGYRVLVVEQTETPEQLELRWKEKGSKDKVVKREICAVITKGTLTEGEFLSANPDASYLMALTESCQSLANQGLERIFGVCVVDVTTSRIILGQFGDDAECSSLCCLLSELRPVEIVKPAKMLSSETERVMVRHTRNPLVSELAPLSEFWDAEKTVQEVKTIYKRVGDLSASGPLNKTDLDTTNLNVGEYRPGCLPSILSELVNKGENGSLALSALGGALYYLKQAFLDETLLRFAKFESLPCSDFCEVAKKPYMILDAAAMDNLEIFENSRNGDTSGTLYAQLNHCVTAFGKRLLKTWLARPLYHLESIKDRQDAVAGLRGVNQPMMLEFQKALSGLPDIERLLARIFSTSEANGRNANKVVLYEDAAKKQLQEFISALRGCELVAQACSSLAVILENVESGRLHHLLTPGKGLPDILPILKHFKSAFDWVEANNSGRIIPHDGVDVEYDSACEKVKEVESSLARHLKEQQKLLGDKSITYVTVGKEAYLLEVPEHLRGSIPQDYELRSSKKGFYRYWTPSIKKFLGELSQAESEKESALKSILQRLIVCFCKYHDKWRQLVSATAELDVLISLAIASDFYEGPACCPTIIGSSLSSEVPCLSAKKLGHPVLRSDSLGKGAFVPNDISIGGSGCASFILLTGPNMGGKSTLLRQVCLAVILAQIGADVPAESFELSPVDRIFVRMGAKDHIMAGQSTFLTELSETALMLSSATRNSLVALDELGRGTSTSDGQAIAESVLEHFVHKVQCRGMFSTHYHRLAVDYQKDSKVSLYHMSCQVGNGVGVEEVTFLYRLRPGACPKSYGVNVARLAGLPDSILHNAAAKSREFEAVYGRHRKGSEGKLAIQNCDKMVVLIRSLINATTCLSGHKSAGIDISSVTKLQDKARIFLQ